MRSLLARVTIAFALLLPMSARAQESPESDPQLAALSACGLPGAVFCDTFDQPENGGTRSGDLNPVVWGVSRTTGNIGFSSLANAWFPTAMELCGGTVTVSPPDDVQICNGQLREALNDGHVVAVLAMYPKQPFDFAGRTGKVVFDVSNDTLGSHDAWPELWMTDKPVPAPFKHQESWDSLPQHGFGVRFAGFSDSNGNGNPCPEGSPAYVGVDSAVIVRNYVPDDSQNGGALKVRGFDCVKASTGPDELNHYEVDVSQDQIDVYGTDAGTTAPLKHLATIDNAALTLTRGLIWIEDAHYNAAKAIEPCECGPHREHTFVWDNVGFDGPFTYHDLSYDALDNIERNSDGTIDLGKPSQAGQSSQWDVLGVDAKRTAAAVRVLFNLHVESIPTAIRVGVNGKQHSIAWPYPDRAISSWRTLAVDVAQSELVDGTNVVSIGSDASTIISNVNIVLVDVDGANPPTPVASATATVAPSQTATITPVPTITPLPTVTAIATPTIAATPGATCAVLVLLDGKLQSVARDSTFCTNQP
jgi:hypothetical protein